jgi:hypothetical protein
MLIAAQAVMDSPARINGRNPMRGRSRPPTALAIGQPIAIGAMAEPASVGVPPSTPCTNRGTNVTVAIIALPINMPPALATAMTRDLNNASGKMGSAARRSTSTKDAPSRAPRGSAQIARDPLAPSMMHATAPPNRRAPAQSSTLERRSTFSWRKRASMAAEARPKGTFT